MTQIRAADGAEPAQWLLRSDVDWWDLVRYGPPGFDVYVRIAFPQDSEEVDTPLDEEIDAVRLAIATLAAYTTTPASGYAAIWEGWACEDPPRAPVVEIPERTMMLFAGPVEALPGAVRRVQYGDPTPTYRDET